MIDQTKFSMVPLGIRHFPIFKEGHLNLQIQPLLDRWNQFHGVRFDLKIKTNFHAEFL